MADYIYDQDGNECDVEDMYRDMLDDCHGEIKIGYLTFYPSNVLEQLDPIAYRCGVSDYESSLIEDGYLEEVYTTDYGAICTGLYEAINLGEAELYRKHDGEERLVLRMAFA